MKNNGWYSRKTALSRTKTLAEEVCAVPQAEHDRQKHSESSQTEFATNENDSETTFGQKTQVERGGGGVKKNNNYN